MNRGGHLRKIVEELVDRLGRALRDIAQQVGHAAFRFAGKQIDAEIEGLLQIGRQRRQHGDAAADVKAADDHRQTELAKLAAEIERARILVRLHADQTDHATTGAADALGDPRNVDDGVALVASFDVDVDVRAEHAVVGAFLDQAIDAGEAVGWQRRAAPLDDIAVLVVVRRLDQNHSERTFGHRSNAPHSERQPRTFSLSQIVLVQPPFGNRA